MRQTLALSALALGLAWAAPSGAQMMCGPGQAGSTTSAQSSGGMMCGMMRPTSQAPATGQQAQPQQRQSMCACCQRMAMMGGQGQGSMEGMMEEMMRQHHPAPQQGTPATPEAPKQP